MTPLSLQDILWLRAQLAEQTLTSTPDRFNLTRIKLERICLQKFERTTYTAST